MEYNNMAINMVIALSFYTIKQKYTLEYCHNLKKMYLKNFL